MLATKSVCASSADVCAAVVWSSPEEVLALDQAVCRLGGGAPDPMLRPAFYLASISEQWKPRVVSVERQGEIVSVVYAKERMIGGVPSGLIFGDATLTAMSVGERQEDVFRAALEKIFAVRGVRGIRLRVLPGSPELRAVHGLIRSRKVDTHYVRIRDHARLTLPDSYENFLRALGGSSRHNFRRYRERFEAARNQYVSPLTASELESAAWQIRTKSSRPTSPCDLRRVLNMLSAAHRPFAAGLRDRDGRWLSIAAGCHRPGSAVMYLQLNDDLDFPNESLSLVLRAFLIEDLIRQRTSELWFWAGVSPPLSRYAVSVRAIEVHLDKPSWTWRAMRWAVSRIGPRLPRHMQQDARSVSPFCS